MSKKTHSESAGQCARLANSASTIMALLNMSGGKSNNACTGAGTLKFNVSIDPACAGLTDASEFWLTFQSKEELERLIAALDDFLSWSGVDVRNKDMTALKKRFDGGYRLKSRGSIDVVKGMYIVTFKKHFYFKMSTNFTRKLFDFVGEHGKYDLDIAA